MKPIHHRPISCLFTFVVLGIVGIMSFLGYVSGDNLVREPSYLISITLFIIVAALTGAIKE